MAQSSDELTDNVKAFPEAAHSTLVSDELAKLRQLVREEFPSAVHVSFEFDARLRVHLDVRRRDDAAIIQSRLPLLGGGNLFTHVGAGGTPHHPFFHRISADVAR